MDGTWIGNTFLLGSSSLAVAAATLLGSIIVGVGTTVDEKGKEADEKHSPYYGQSGQLVQSWGMLHSGPRH